MDHAQAGHQSWGYGHRVHDWKEEKWGSVSVRRVGSVSTAGFSKLRLVSYTVRVE